MTSDATAARLILGEIERLARAGGDWRALVMAKRVFELDRDLRPTPDGLSAAYLSLAADLLREARDAAAVGAAEPSAGALLLLADGLIQDEVATALLAERRLAALADAAA